MFNSPKNLLNQKKLFPKKKLGQNFLKDKNITEMIVSRSGISAGDVVLEIGSGLFALTIPLAHTAKKVTAVEKDRDLTSIIKDNFGINGPDSLFPNVHLIEAGILDVDIDEIAAASGEKLKVFGNLPYNISSQILVKLIKSKKSISRAVLMFQKELAERITAPPNTRGYGRLSVMLGYCSKIKTLAEIGAGSFYPKPKVDSVVIDIQFFRKNEYVVDDEAFFFQVIKAAFGQRRKTLKNALSGSELILTSTQAEKALIASGIDPVRRAETLTVKEFVDLTHALSVYIFPQGES